MTLYFKLKNYQRVLIKAILPTSPFPSPSERGWGEALPNEKIIDISTYSFFLYKYILPG
jgi:hypothetical protein